MKFRIGEFNEVEGNKKVFAVQSGTVVWEHWYKRKIVWSWVTEKDGITKSFDTFNEAKIYVDDLKKQIPIFYNIK